MNFDQEILVAKFLACIDNRENPGLLYAVYYNTMAALSKENRSFKYIERKFLDINNIVEHIKIYET